MSIFKEYPLGLPLVGIGAATVGALFFFGGFKKSPSSKKYSALERSKVLSILKTMNKEFYNIFSNLSLIALQIKDQTQGKIPPKELKEILLNQGHFVKEIEELEERIYSDFKVKKRDFKQSCLVTFKEDREIQGLMLAMKNSMENAATGNPPDNTTSIPKFLTAEMALELMQRIMQETVKLMKGSFAKLKEQGETISLENPKILQALNTIKVEDTRKKILSESGLDNFEDPPAKIFQFATQKFAKDIPEFKEKMMQLEIKHKGAFEKILTDPSLSDDFIEKSITVTELKIVGQKSKALTKENVGALNNVENEPLIKENEDFMEHPEAGKRVQTDGLEGLMEPMEDEPKENDEGENEEINGLLSGNNAEPSHNEEVNPESTQKPENLPKEEESRPEMEIMEETPN